MLIQEVAKVVSDTSAQAQGAVSSQAWSIKDLVPNVINGAAAFGSLLAAGAAWATQRSMLKMKHEEDARSAPILQFLNANFSFPNLMNVKERLYLIISYANARKNKILTMRHIGFVINGNYMVYGCNPTELIRGGELDDSLTFNALFPSESEVINHAWSCIFFIEVIDTAGHLCKEVCYIRIPDRDQDEMPTCELHQLSIGTNNSYTYYQNSFIPLKEKGILKNYIKSFSDPKWISFCNQFKDNLK